MHTGRLLTTSPREWRKFGRRALYSSTPLQIQVMGGTGWVGGGQIVAWSNPLSQVYRQASSRQTFLQTPKGDTACLIILSETKKNFIHWKPNHIGKRVSPAFSPMHWGFFMCSANIRFSEVCMNYPLHFGCFNKGFPRRGVFFPLLNVSRLHSILHFQESLVSNFSILSLLSVPWELNESDSIRAAWR